MGIPSHYIEHPAKGLKYVYVPYETMVSGECL